MLIDGLPEFFWIVTKPTSISTAADICFRCSFPQFAVQIRGGLHENEIVAIFAEESKAKGLTESLLSHRLDATKP